MQQTTLVQTATPHLGQVAAIREAALWAYIWLCIKKPDNITSLRLCGRAEAEKPKFATVPLQSAEAKGMGYCAYLNRRELPVFFDLVLLY
jgi:hypothetical protein